MVAKTDLGGWRNGSYAFEGWSSSISTNTPISGSALVFGMKSPKVEGSSPLLLALFFDFLLRFSGA